MKIVCAPAPEGDLPGLFALIGKLLQPLFKSVRLSSTNRARFTVLLLRSGFCTALILLAKPSTSQVAIQTQPAAVSNCQPISSTGYSLSVAIKKGSCNNINTGNVAVIWQFSPNNATWTNVAAATPAGYSYSSANSDGGGSGANAIVINTLNV